MREEAQAGGASLRLDKCLYFLRFARSRSIAKAIAEAGHLRLNGRRIWQAHTQVRVGDILSIPLPSGVRVVKIVGLPCRRGPASEVRDLIALLDRPQASHG